MLDANGAAGPQAMLSLLPKGQNPLRLPPWTTHNEAVAELDLVPFIKAGESLLAPGLTVALPTIYTQLSSCVTLRPRVDFWFEDSYLQHATDRSCPPTASAFVTYPADRSGYWGQHWFSTCGPSLDFFAAFGKFSARDNDTLSDMTVIRCQQTTKL